MEEESEDTYDLIGRRAREQRDKSVTSWRRSRIAGLVDAISSGAVKAPESVLKALREALIPKPQDSARDDTGGQPEQKKPASPTASVESDIDVLAQSFKNGSREEQIGAAACIAYAIKALSISPGPDFHPTRLYLSNETPALLRGALTAADSDAIPEVQRDLLKAFPVLKFGGNELLPVFKRLLRAQHADVQIAVITAIRALGIDQAAGIVKELINLLADSVQSVQIAICETLAWLGTDAAQAISTLLDHVRDDGKPDVRLAAARALTVIDRNGIALSKIKNQDKRESLITALALLGKDGRQLRQLLPALWAKDDASFPARWMSIPKIAEATGLGETTLRREINKKVIRPHDKKGEGKGTRYLVTDADLEAWKQL